jgi:hypothetical protein
LLRGFSIEQYCQQLHPGLNSTLTYAAASESPT